MPCWSFLPQRHKYVGLDEKIHMSIYGKSIHVMLPQSLVYIYTVLLPFSIFLLAGKHFVRFL